LRIIDLILTVIRAFTFIHTHTIKFLFIACIN